ncbi:hypothetical protein [Kitasatospora sp. NPDC093679]|uniref:hypothetical protein n=1 Tax=Kitasatospora sp. NPDC093679 TaxID=3154983 RepID=UPI003448C2FA
MGSHVFDLMVGSPDRDGFDTLGFDPAPGNVPGVQELVLNLQQAAKELEDARASVQRASNNGQAWQGEAADAFSARIAKLPAQLDVARASFSSAHRTMATWQDQLAALQRKADDQEAEAKAAKARCARAEDNPDLDLLGRWIPDEQMAEARARYTVAAAELDSANADFHAIVAQAKALRSEHDKLAKEAAAAVAKAGADAPDGPGWFANLVDGIKTLAQAHVQLAQDAMQWAKDHANAIKAVGDMLSNASSAMGLASLALAGAAALTVEIPPLALVLGTASAATGAASTALSVGALGAHSVAAAAGADVPTTAFGFDVAGSLPVVGSLGKAGQIGARLAGFSRTADTVSGTGSGLSGLGWLDDASGIGQFVPREGRQWGELLLPGGPLLVGLENAWSDGSDADREHHAKAGG